MRIATVLALSSIAALGACEAPDWKMKGEREPEIAVSTGAIGAEAKKGATPAGAVGGGDQGVRPLEPVGSPRPLSTDGDENLQWAASVVQLVPIEGQGAKLFSTAGGDPAVNGLYTYMAFFAGPADGWSVYRLGDFRDVGVRAITPGRLDLEITEDAVDPGSGEIVQSRRRAIVRWTPGPDGAPPTRVTVTPAR